MQCLEWRVPSKVTIIKCEQNRLIHLPRARTLFSVKLQSTLAVHQVHWMSLPSEVRCSILYLLLLLLSIFFFSFLSFVPPFNGSYMCVWKLYAIASTTLPFMGRRRNKLTANTQNHIVYGLPYSMWNIVHHTTYVVVVVRTAVMRTTTWIVQCIVVIDLHTSSNSMCMYLVPWHSSMAQDEQRQLSGYLFQCDRLIVDKTTTIADVQIITI